MEQATICLCVRDDQVLLAMKKRGFGAGKWNGYGGKLQPGDATIRHAAVRELEEESGIIADERGLEQAALIRFSFEGVPKFECHVFVAREWQNEAVETDEMRPQWFSASALPFEGMWAADRTWMPLVLAGEKLEASVDFNHDGSVVKKYSHKPAEFA